MSNELLAALYVKNGKSLGIEFEHGQIKPLAYGASTDMGNVSRVLPSIHPEYSLNIPSGPHTTEFRDVASKYCQLCFDNFIDIASKCLCL
uniref:Uncharacterized protein n=1 Tax=Arion vulgaris TaxID=1028688 RepID=A0A0B6ZYX3_9EUPU